MEGEYSRYYLRKWRARDLRHPEFEPPHGFTLIEGAGFVPGDDRLVYSYARLEESDGKAFWGDIYVGDLEGASSRPLTATPFIHDENHEFSPHGRKIPWSASQGYPGDGEELWLMDADGSNKTRLTRFTDPAFPEYDPPARQITESAWSPEGNRVAFGHVSQVERSDIHIPSTLYMLALE